MPDNVSFQSVTPATPPDTTIVAADDVGGIKYQVIKIDVGGDGLSAPLSTSNPVPVSDAGGSLTVDNGGTFAVQVSSAIPAGNNNIGDVDVASVTGNVTVVQPTATNLKVDASGVAVPITDNSSSLTVDGTLAVTQSGTWDEVGINDSGNSITVDNGGTFVTQENGAALTSLQLIDDTVIADDAAFTPATTKVVMAGFEADESSTDSVDEGDGGAARMTLDRKVIVTPQGHTSGGLSTFMASGSDGSTALTSTAQVLKASAGQVYGYYVYNPNATAQFVHFYNVAAASVTVGTTNPLFTLTVPATSAANLSLAIGITFSNAGFSIAATATAGGNGAPSSALDAVVWYM